MKIYMDIYKYIYYDDSSNNDNNNDSNSIPTWKNCLYQPNKMMPAKK